MDKVQIRFLPAYCNFVLYSSRYRVIVSGINLAISWNSSYLYIALHNETVLSRVRISDSCSNLCSYTVSWVGHFKCIFASPKRGSLFYTALTEFKENLPKFVHHL